MQPLLCQENCFFTDILGMEDANGNSVVLVDAQSPTKFNILGYPVIINDFVAEDTIIFGDFSYYHFNWAKGVEKLVPMVPLDLEVAQQFIADLHLQTEEEQWQKAFVKYTRAT